MVEHIEALARREKSEVSRMAVGVGHEEIKHDNAGGQVRYRGDNGRWVDRWQGVAPWGEVQRDPRGSLILGLGLNHASWRHRQAQELPDAATDVLIDDAVRDSGRCH